MAMTSISKELEKKIIKAAETKAAELAKEAKDSLQSEYIKLIKEFYQEQVFQYDNIMSNVPKYYDRNFNYKYDDKNILISGLGHTFKSYTRTLNDRNVFVGGIRISTDYMKNEDYNGTYDQVLYSFLNGWHGLPSQQYGGIPTGHFSDFGPTYNIYDRMVDYREKLKEELGKKFVIHIE